MKISLKLLFLLNSVFVLGNTIKTSNDTVESYVKNIFDFDNIVKLHYEDKISNEALKAGKTGQHCFFRNDNVTVLPLQ
ncbi:hypothetical protein H8356DRAFT_1429116 [Neocallimastix lanati (nom. inval.)]|nr:hypothetical protein H8356DRAFT_1429116 [Neocallimastix sp. JGI-2020a]